MVWIREYRHNHKIPSCLRLPFPAREHKVAQRVCALQWSWQGPGCGCCGRRALDNLHCLGTASRRPPHSCGLGLGLHLLRGVGLAPLTPDYPSVVRGWPRRGWLLSCPGHGRPLRYIGPKCARHACMPPARKRCDGRAVVRWCNGDQLLENMFNAQLVFIRCAGAVAQCRAMLAVDAMVQVDAMRGCSGLRWQAWRQCRHHCLRGLAYIRYVARGT